MGTTEFRILKSSTVWTGSKDSGTWWIWRAAEARDTAADLSDIPALGLHAFRRWRPSKREVCCSFFRPRHLTALPPNSSYIFTANPHMSSLEKWLSRAFSSTVVLGGRNGLSSAPQSPSSSIISFIAVASSRSGRSLLFPPAKCSPHSPERPHLRPNPENFPPKHNRFMWTLREDSVCSVGFILSPATTVTAEETSEWLERLPEPPFPCRMSGIKAKQL